MIKVRSSRGCWFPVAGMLFFSLAVSIVSFPARGSELDEKTLAGQMLGSLSDRSGLCVHLGFSDVRLTTQLSNGGRFLVHGLNTDRQAVEEGRKTIRSQGLAGAVSVEHHTLDRLPYANNLVNLLVVEELSDTLNRSNILDELLRVIRPGGVAFVRKSALGERNLKQQLAKSGVSQFDQKKLGSSIWYQFRKPRPDAMDEWTHRRYDSTRNAVSRDKVSVPSGVRWITGPNWPRNSPRWTR